MIAQFSVGVVDNTEWRSRHILSDGAILEMVIWRVPQAVAGSRHTVKYRLYYGRDGIRIVGYDNERNKGDHRHLVATSRIEGGSKNAAGIAASGRMMGERGVAEMRVAEMRW